VLAGGGPVVLADGGSFFSLAHSSWLALSSC